jgi:hypothetical protein
MHAFNAEKTITQPYVQNHKIHQASVHCVEETIPQATQDVKCTRICKKTEASQSTKLFTDPSNKGSMLAIIINSLLSTQIKLRFKSHTSTPAKPATTLYTRPIFNVSEFKTKFNQLSNQISMILSLVNTVNNKITIKG